MLILREPYQATCCGKSFCKECIHRIKAANQICPTCNDKDFTLFPNKGLQQSLYDFQVYCTHKSKGCEWTGELRELDNHLNSDPPADKSLQGCLYTLIKCPLGCAGCAGCEKGVCRTDIKSHVNDKLLSHVMRQNAQMKSFEQQLQEYRSSNAQLAAQLEKSKSDKEHLEQRMAKLEMKVNELNVKYPMVVSSSGQSQHPDTHVTGTYKPVGTEFTMINFEEYKRDGDRWFSPHLYTHPNDYKMCLSVDANDCGTGRDTHLAVSMHLMRGEFDDQLKWPFRGNVIIKLVNQEEDKDHIVYPTEFNSDTPNKTCRRVMIEGYAADNGWGFAEFLPHTKLQPKYLKNECIKLCIKTVELY